MKRTMVRALLAVTLCMPVILTSGTADAASDEYWCYGERLHLSYGSDSAQVSWKIVDGAGKVICAEEGTDIYVDIPSEYSCIFVTQTVSTGYGSAEQRVTVNMVHLGGKSIEVSFYRERGSPPVSVQLFDARTVRMNGVFLEMPDEPVPPGENMEFGGWYTQIGGREVEVTENYYIGRDMQEDVEVYAKWLRIGTLLFLSHGELICSAETVEGSPAELPELPSADGRRFAGWYADSQFRVPFDSDSEFSESQILYAKWIEEDEEQTLMNPVLLLPIGALLMLAAYSHMKRQKSKGKKRKRYL